MTKDMSDKISEGADVEKLSLKELFQACLKKWAWFLVSLIICLGAGYLYIKSQQPVYQRSEEILVKDQEAGGGIGGMSSTFASLGLISGKTNVFNELISMTSPAILAEVIDRLKLYVNYEEAGTFHGTDLYGTTLPFEVNFIDLGPQDGAGFKCEISGGGNIRLYDFYTVSIEGKTVKLPGEVNNIKKGSVTNSPVGKIQLVDNPSYLPLNNAKKGGRKEISITKSGMQSAIENYESNIQGDLKEEYADIIQLVIRDVNVERAVDILNEIVTVYNDNWVEDKNKIAKATSNFIEERLHIIEKELGDVDTNIAKYVSSTGSIDLSQSGTLLMEKEDELETAIVDLNNNLTLCKYMLDYLKSDANKNSIVPNNTGVQSPEVESQIQTYNELLLTRNALESSSSASNPLVKDYDTQLSNLRNALMKGMSNRILQLEKQLSSAVNERNKARGSLQANPIQSLPLLSEKRQQAVKESLYLFLLEKREENELSQKFTADNIRIITPPMGSLRPVSPKKKIIMLFMLIIGVAIPLLVIYVKKTGDTKVRGKKDLERVKIPFAGEIPQVGKPGKLKNLGNTNLKRRKDEKAPISVVEEGKRDVVNEAFRVIRSNIDFMIGKNKDKAEVIMLTSFNPGSGKSFISYNLGLSFAIKKKRVLLVDCDLRHGSSSMYVNNPTKGLSDYLTESTSDWHSLVKKSPSQPSIDIMPIGKIPPNPAELLENGRLDELIKEAKQEYDVIILDCPPVNIVVDTQIVGQMVDRTLFVVRAGLLEKSALKELNEFYDEKKFKNMSVLLNGTTASNSRYYTYGTYQHYNEN